MPKSRCRNTLADWLELNELTRETVQRQLELIGSLDDEALDSLEAQCHLGLTPDEAWAFCAEAMRAAFPGLEAEANKVETNVPKCLQPKSIKHPVPFTYDLGFQRMPFISLHYQDRAADLLAMAHEFGHAMQIVASWQSGEGQMPPIGRDSCAFMAELALLNAQNEKVEALLACHQADDVAYFGENKATLENAVLDDQSPYQYNWNYPLARQLATQLVNADEADQAVAIFRAGRGGGRLLARLLSNVEAGGLAA